MKVSDLGRVVDQLRAEGRGDYGVSPWLEGLTPEADELQGLVNFSLRLIEVPGSRIGTSCSQLGRMRSGLSKRMPNWSGDEGAAGPAAGMRGLWWAVEPLQPGKQLPGMRHWRRCTALRCRV